MNKRGGVFSIGPKEVMYLVIGSLIILTTFVIFTGIGKQLLGGGGEDQAMKNNFKLVSKAFDKIMSNPARYASTEVPIFLGDEAVLVGFDTKWDETKDVSRCGGIVPVVSDDEAYRPIKCQQKGCLVLYSDDEHTDKGDTNKYIIDLKRFEGDVFFAGEPDPGYRASNAYGNSRTLQVQSSVYKADFKPAYMLIYGQCGNGPEMAQKLFHIEKFVEGEGQSKKTYIYIVQVRGEETDEDERNIGDIHKRRDRLYEKFGITMETYEDYLEAQEYDKIIEAVGQELALKRAELESRGDLDDVHYYAGRALFLIAQDIEKHKGKVKKPTTPIMFRIAFPTQSSVLRKSYEWYLKALAFQGDVDDKYPTIFSDLLQDEKILTEYLLSMPKQDALNILQETHPQSTTFTYATKKILVDNVAHFLELNTKTQVLLFAQKPVSEDVYSGDQRKALGYALIEAYVKKFDTKLTSTDILEALKLLENLKKYFPEDPDYKEKKWSTFVDDICAPSPSKYFTAQDFTDEQFRPIATKCAEIKGKGSDEEQLTFFLATARTQETQGKTELAIDSYIGAAKLVLSKLKATHFSQYKEAFTKADTLIKTLPEDKRKAKETDLVMAHPSPLEPNKFTEYITGLQYCTKGESLECITELEKLLIFYPVSLMDKTLADPDGINMLKALIEAYKQTNQQKRCQEKIITQLPSVDTPNWNALRTECVTT